MQAEIVNIIVAVVTAAAIGAGAILVRIIKRRVKLTGPLAEAVDLHGKQLIQMRPLVMMLIVVQKPQLVALLCILDALKDKTNGDFARAHTGVKDALDKFDETLVNIAGGECVERKAQA